MEHRRIQTLPKESLLARYSQTLGELALRRHTEQAIRAAKHEAELNSRSKSAFLSTMSHELRTPLNAIIGFSDLIRNADARHASPEKDRDYAAQIAQAGRRLLEVVSDVLDISKLESGALVLEPRLCDPCESVRTATETVRARFDAKQQTLELRLESDIPRLMLDPARLRQILVNLLSNANKFTPQRGRIIVMARRNSDGGVAIAVSDTGIGMSAEQIAIAAKPFAQVQSGYTRNQEGTGLGLPIALGLARLHGGKLIINSEPQAGTTVILTVPPIQGERERLAS